MSTAHDLKSEEELLGLRMVKERLLTETQLNTALDFQRAVGGTLPEVLVRLDLVDRTTLDTFLARSWAGGKPGRASGRGPGGTGAGDDRTAPVKRGGAKSGATGTGASGGSKGSKDVLETSIVLDALVRLLVRKGVIRKAELKEEVLRIDPEEVLHR